jgi:hypothetical protein
MRKPVRKLQSALSDIEIGPMDENEGDRYRYLQGPRRRETALKAATECKR